MPLVHPAEEYVDWVFPVVGMRGDDLWDPGGVCFGHLCCFQGDVFVCLLCILT